MRRRREIELLLRDSAASHKVAATITVTNETSWASSRFEGARFTMTVDADDDEALDPWLIALPDTDLPIGGGFVADVDVVARDTGAATIELLVIED